MGTEDAPPTISSTTSASCAIQDDTESMAPGSSAQLGNSGSNQQVASSCAASESVESSVGSGGSGRYMVKPVTASHILDKRYDKKCFAKIQQATLEIHPGRATWIDDNDSRSGWNACVHPEGALYFRKLEESCIVFTSSDLRNSDSGVRERLSDAVDRILTQAREAGVSIGADTELVLDLEEDNDDSVGYYLVNHQGRCLMWAEIYKDAKIFEDIEGVISMSHIKHAMEAQYWGHMEAFPYGKRLDETMYLELGDLVLHASAERLSSDTSLSPYDGDELDTLRGMLESLKDRVDKINPHAVCIVARFSRTFARSRIYNFCGQPEARLDADMSVHATPIYPPHWAFIILSLSMFGTPASQLERLNEVWVDCSVNTARWKEYITTVYDEFTGVTLYSTVMLAVDVSFLAVPGVGSGSSGNENAPTVSTYVSIIAIIGSMTLSLLLSADARRRISQSADQAADLLSIVSSSMFGLEALAVMYTLPFSLLMWGMLFFLAGLCARIFPHAARYTIGSCAVALFILVLVVTLPLYTWWRIKNWTPLMFHALQRLFQAPVDGNQRKTHRFVADGRAPIQARRSSGDLGAQGSTGQTHRRLRASIAPLSPV